MWSFPVAKFIEIAFHLMSGNKIAFSEKFFDKGKRKGKIGAPINSLFIFAGENPYGNAFGNVGFVSGGFVDKFADKSAASVGGKPEITFSAVLFGKGAIATPTMLFSSGSTSKARSWM